MECLRWGLWLTAGSRNNRRPTVQGREDSSAKSTDFSIVPTQGLKASEGQRNGLPSSRRLGSVQRAKRRVFWSMLMPLVLQASLPGHHDPRLQQALVHKDPALSARYGGVLRFGPRSAESCGHELQSPSEVQDPYRVTNWAEYDQALVNGGDVTLWITPEAIKGWRAKPSGRRGAPQKYTDLAIETALTLRLLFRLPLRQAEGFLRSLLDLMDLSLEAPDHTTLSRRSKNLNPKLTPIASKKPIHLIIDSTGLKVINKTKGKLSSVTGDAAYDTVAIYEQAASRGARIVVPPARSASVLGDRLHAPSCAESRGRHRPQDLEPAVVLGQASAEGHRSLNQSMDGDSSNQFGLCNNAVRSAADMAMKDWGVEAGIR